MVREDLVVLTVIVFSLVVLLWLTIGSWESKWDKQVLKEAQINTVCLSYRARASTSETSTPGPESPPGSDQGVSSWQWIWIDFRFKLDSKIAEAFWPLTQYILFLPVAIEKKRKENAPSSQPYFSVFTILFQCFWEALDKSGRRWGKHSTVPHCLVSVTLSLSQFLRLPES